MPLLRRDLCPAFLMLAAILAVPLAPDLAPAYARHQTGNPAGLTVGQAQAAIEAAAKIWEASDPDRSLGTPGNRIGYGLPHARAGKMLEASWSFEDAARTAPSDAMSQYLFGVSLAALGPDERVKAEKALREAVRLATGELKPLAEKALADFTRPAPPAPVKPARPTAASAPPKKPAPKASLPRKQDSPPSAPPAVGAPAAPPLGSYNCLHVRWDVAEKRTKLDYKGYFTLLSSNTYRWLDSGPVGKYSYDPAKRRVRFVSGHLAQEGLEATFGLDADGKTPEILLRFHTEYSRTTGYDPVEWQAQLQKK